MHSPSTTYAKFSPDKYLWHVLFMRPTLGRGSFAFYSPYSVPILQLLEATLSEFTHSVLVLRLS